MTTELVTPLDGGRLAVETVDLQKHFGTRTALAGLDLTVPEGAVYLLAGPNGAGKTTALRLLLDLLPADSGGAEVLGFDVVADGAEARARIGYVPENQDFGYCSLPVGRLFTHHAAYFPAWDEGYARQLIRALEVDPDTAYGRLSKGQARRVQLVLALAHRPPLLLLDEPTDGLDLLAREQVLEILADHLASTPTTVLVSTHVVHEVEGLVDCVGILAGGRLVAQQSRRELANGLVRLRAEVPADWQPPAELADAAFERRERGREISWVLWGGEEAARARLAASGAIPRHVEQLRLEETVRALLAGSRR